MTNYRIKPNKQERKYRLKKKLVIVLAVVLIVCVGFLLYLNYVANPVIIYMSHAKVRSLTQSAINSAVYEITNSNGPIYDDIINVRYDNGNKVSMLTVNSLEANKLSRNLVELSQVYLERLDENFVDVPIGSLCGLPILAGRGPCIKVQLMPIGSITCSFVSEFLSSGINQTIHRIYVNISSNVSVVLPTANQNITNTTQMMIAESILLGEIPETYLNSHSIEEMLNLV